MQALQRIMSALKKGAGSGSSPSSPTSPTTGSGCTSYFQTSETGVAQSNPCAYYVPGSSNLINNYGTTTTSSDLLNSLNNPGGTSLSDQLWKEINTNSTG